MQCHRFLFATLLASFAFITRAETKPIRALLVTGGCCHDYTKQKIILTDGISARANVVWSIVHEGDGTTDHKLSIYEDPDWAKNYDVIVHDECFADVKDAEFVRRILQPHRKGLPAVNLHCAMHCYRVDFDHFKEWFEFTGLDTRSHGAQIPIEISATTVKHPILNGFANWTTVPEELYNNLEIWKTVTPLLRGKQGAEDNIVAWVNDYRGTRVFSTTLGHNNATVSDQRYLDLVTRGLLWAVNKLDADHLKPARVRRKAQKTIRVPINLALHKKASASGSQEGHSPEHATDDESETRWCAPDNGNNYSWQVDLGSEQEIVGTRIHWEHENAPYEFRIEGSADAKSWDVMAEVKGSVRPQIDEQKFSAKQVRYVRITITKAPDGHWASFFEFEVLGKELIEKAASFGDSRLVGVQAPAGFETTLFAGPPDISYPTCLETTPWGDVFVGVDLNGSLDREKERGRVVRCRDTDADGVANQFTTFATMDSPRGLVFDGKTLYVMHPPVLEAFNDDNNDGVADRSEILVRGLANDLNFRGADHTCNGVRMGIDGWLYIALGDYGALNAAAKDGSHIQLHGGGIVRVRPDGSNLEIVVEGTRNIYDVAIDPFMNLFTCDNTNDGDDWNVRLSHMISTAHYGYPSLFKNFPDEIMPAMKDFGGGSPTGAFFLDEPAFDETFGRGLYICQWGWNNVSRHPLKASGATFSADKETFLRIPRPTGIATDGLGNLFVASWKGATFNYAGPNAGFVVRVSPINGEPVAFPNLRRQSEKQLIHLLNSRSATQRLQVQREILRRKPTKTLIDETGKVAFSSRDAAVCSAAVFTLGQIEHPLATEKLLQLAGRDDLREFALRALADSHNARENIELFATSLRDPNPRVRREAVIALNRLGKAETAEQIFKLTIDTDSAVAHAAFRALVSFKAANVCLDALSESDLTRSTAALRILRNIHRDEVINGLIKRLDQAEASRFQILETLCRLYFREADWDGSWWTTRPDTSGPYYKPVDWEGTSKIREVLSKEIAKNDPQTTRFLLIQFQKYKINFPDVPVSAYGSLIADKSLEANLRKQAFHHALKLSDLDAARSLLNCERTDKVANELRDEFVRDPARLKKLDAFVQFVSQGTEDESELGYTVLLLTSRNTNATAIQKEIAEKLLRSGLNSAALQKAKNALHWTEETALPIRISDDAIGKLSYETATRLILAAPGDAKIGAQLFENVGCIKCHTISKNEAPKGPFLGDITARYTKAEILESILRPSAKVSQGFETTAIGTKEGESIDGFVVRDSGEEVELRNISGATVIAKKNIARRETRATSIMPDGLADGLTPGQVSSLLFFLETKRKEN